MNIHWIDKKSEGDTDLQLEAVRKLARLTDINDADVIFCGSIDTAVKAMYLKDETKKPLAVYCWDYYTWAHAGQHPGSWDWKQYAELLKAADLVIVPSTAQQLLLQELLNLDSVVVRSGVRQRNVDVQRKKFILDPVRYYPDPNRTWAEEAAKELKVKIIHSEHGYSAEEFEKLVATCMFMTCAYREASTGGLTLAEGLLLGKPSLVSDSPYMGAADYLGDYGFYFQADNFQHLKEQMQYLWAMTPKVKVSPEFRSGLSFDRMAQELCQSFQKLL